MQRKAKVSLIRLQNYERAHMILKRIGVRFSSMQQLLFCLLIDTHGRIPYGFNRNQVLMEALFTGMDYLIFVVRMCSRACCAKCLTGTPV